MALVHTVGIQVQDFTGGRKSMAIYVPATTTLTTLQTELNTYLPYMDAVIDAKIISADVTLALTLPGGMKSSPVAGNTAREGALLKYGAAATAFTFGLYVPSWMNAGFAGNAVLTTGAYGTFQGDLLTFASDRDGNAINAFISGKRAFRK